MRLRFAFLILCTVLAARGAYAQFNAVLYNLDQPLTLACGSGGPVLDGATVQIFWDSLGNGPTADDHLAPEGPGFLEANFNQFLLNGTALLEVPGGFATDPAFTMFSGIPDPNNNTGHPLYWLRVCLAEEGIYWQSDTFRVFPGLNDYFFGTGEDQTPFTCITGVCSGCPTPSDVTALTASTTHCDSIVVDWTHDLDNIAGYRILVDEGGDYIYIQGGANSRYVDLVSQTGIEHTYDVRAYRVCGADTAISSSAVATGRAIVLPPTPQGMVASDDQCGRVEVNWSVNTVLGLDSFMIYRNNVIIGRTSRGNAGEARQFFDNAPLPATANYCVRGWSALCGLGDAACDSGSAETAPVCTITNVAATGDCDGVCVTFTSTCADAVSWEIFRSNVSVGTLPNTGGPNFSFCYAAPTTAGTFQVRAVNACGNGSLVPEPGISAARLAVPAAVGTIVATDTLCDKVRVTWATMANIDSFQIRMNTVRIGVVAGNVLLFDHTAAVPGDTRTYTVVAYNECGAGAVAGGNAGTRRAAGTGTATFTLVTAGPPNWTYSMDVLTGCMNTVVIRDFCAGTTATAPTGWTVSVTDDSIIFSTTTPVGGADPVVTGFGLSHPTCDGNGRWGIGQSGGSIRGPLPVGENVALPTEYSVLVYPNPFNPQTNFKIAIPQASETRIVIFNVTGQIVSDMTLGRLQAGYHTVQFGGAELPSGMYFARVLAGSFSSTHKLMLLK